MLLPCGGWCGPIVFLIFSMKAQSKKNIWCFLYWIFFCRKKIPVSSPRLGKRDTKRISRRKEGRKKGRKDEWVRSMEKEEKENQEFGVACCWCWYYWWCWRRHNEGDHMMMMMTTHEAVRLFYHKIFLSRRGLYMKGRVESKEKNGGESGQREREPRKKDGLLQFHPPVFTHVWTHIILNIDM